MYGTPVPQVLNSPAEGRWCPFLGYPPKAFTRVEPCRRASMHTLLSLRTRMGACCSASGGQEGAQAFPRAPAVRCLRSQAAAQAVRVWPIPVFRQGSCCFSCYRSGSECPWKRVILHPKYGSTWSSLLPHSVLPDGLGFASVLGEYSLHCHLDSISVTSESGATLHA